MPKLAGIQVRGISIGGIETCIELPGFKLAFDIGRCPRSSVTLPTVLFTHAHMDHMGGVALHAATRSLFGMPPPTYVVPERNVADFNALFEVWRRLDGSDLEYTLVSLKPGQEHELPNRLVVRPFHSPHRIWCQGYGLWKLKTKLKREFQGEPERRLAELRGQGVEIVDTLETCEVAFTGDTGIEVLEREEAVRRARLLIIEVTFLDERVDPERARSQGHVHLDDVLARADLFENEQILFTHFSSRYKRGEIERLLAERLPPHLAERVTPLLDGHKV